jgi:hypothetical protein
MATIQGETQAKTKFLIQVPVESEEGTDWVLWDTCHSVTFSGPEWLAGRFCLKRFRIVNTKTEEVRVCEMKALPW